MMDAEKIEPELLKVKRTTIREVAQQIKTKQDELARIHAQAQQFLGIAKPGTTCTCGAILPDGAKFCTICGLKIETASASA